ncbi:DUF2909 domain-containing protein [Thalassotalea psychrophila]|uniref:DUF2909 domain-containing protein n=1 Tax=Thalassotalea psychrophila TaxID=3065647 RepID=A0ABY9TT77_9GAMM|nr:DUF2909 domain-containing protein [Colwelliaceae bacterium SQ149]
MVYKIFIAVFLAFMIYNLFRAMVIMNKNSSEQPPMSKYIGRRVIFSAIIVLILLIGIATGLITPNPRPY